MGAAAPVTSQEVSLTVDDRTVRGPASDRVVLTVSGCLDHETAWLLRERLIRLLDEGHRCFVLDLDGVEFLDSTGLGVLAGGLSRARRVRGSLQLVCTREPVLNVLRVTGLLKVFSVHPSVDSAAAALAGTCAPPDDEPADATPDGSAA